MDSTKIKLWHPALVITPCTTEIDYKRAFWVFLWLSFRPPRRLMESHRNIPERSGTWDISLINTSASLFLCFLRSVNQEKRAVARLTAFTATIVRLFLGCCCDVAIFHSCDREPTTMVSSVFTPQQETIKFFFPFFSPCFLWYVYQATALSVCISSCEKWSPPFSFRSSTLSESWEVQKIKLA